MSPLVLQMINEDNFNELDDYGAPFREDSKRMGPVISLCSNSDHLNSLIPRLASNFIHLLSCGNLVEYFE